MFLLVGAFNSFTFKVITDMYKPILSIVDEAQAGIKISRRNVNNLRYIDDTTLMAENEEKLNSLLMNVKEESEKLA